MLGTPEHSLSYGSLPHLTALLKDCFSYIVSSRSRGEVGGGDGSPAGLTLAHLLSLPVVLIGFSKGCVVLNQMLHELSNYIGQGTTPPPVPAHPDYYSNNTGTCMMHSL